MFENFNISNSSAQPFLTIIFSFVGPFCVLFLQRYLNKKEMIKSKQINIFYTLKTTQQDNLSYKHIEALNMIEMEYNCVPKVINSWNEYFSHLCNSNMNYDTKLWLHEKDKLLANLLYEMSVFLGYKYTKLDIKTKIYRPQAYGDEEKINKEIREAIHKILFKNEGSLPVTIKNQDTNN